VASEVGHGYIKGNAGTERRFLKHKSEGAAGQQRTATSVLEGGSDIEDAKQFVGGKIRYRKKVAVAHGSSPGKLFKYSTAAGTARPILRYALASKGRKEAR
jgi:hypothetical protein